MIRIRIMLSSLPDVRVWRHHVDNRVGMRTGMGIGVADLIGVGPGGRFLALEVKRPSTRHRTTQDQKRWLATVRRLGGVAEVVTSPEEALEIVERMRRGQL